MDYAAIEHMLDDTADESRVTLANLRLQVGDDWYHDIRVESVDRADPSLVYPRCVTGRRACPPEDCGGPGGFDELVAALENKDHPEHEMYSEWMETIGQVDYDPARFELAGINEVLAHCSTGARQGQPRQ